MKSNHNNILIIFDAAGYTPVSMHTATELAAAMQAGIQALYIEDDNLLNAVDLPFTREVSLHTAAISKIDSTVMMQKFRVEAENIKRQIEQIAISRSVSFSFSSMRGQKSHVIQHWTDNINMVLIPASYSRTQTIRQAHEKHEVGMVYEADNPSSDKALDIAASQAAKVNHPLFVLADSEQSKQHIEQLLTQKGGTVDCHIADFSDMEQVIRLLSRHAIGLLVLPEHNRLLKNEQVCRQLINTMESDILLVR